MRSPLERPSMRCTISVLKGPPSSLSAGAAPRGVGVGSSEAGVPGMGTGDAECRSKAARSASRLEVEGGREVAAAVAAVVVDVGVVAVVVVAVGREVVVGFREGLGVVVEEAGFVAVGVRAAPVEARRASPFAGCVDGRRSLSVKNLLSSSWRVVREAPLPLRGLSLLVWLLLLLLPLRSVCGRAFTATKPPLGDCEGWVRLASVELAACAAPFMRATLEGLEARIAAPGLAVARLSRMACLRPFRRWFSWRVRAATAKK
jgi:hypothetical protein